jgi:hypothetical protein
VNYFSHHLGQYAAITARQVLPLVSSTRRDHLDLEAEGRPASANVSPSRAWPRGTRRWPQVVRQPRLDLGPIYEPVASDDWRSARDRTSLTSPADHGVPTTPLKALVDLCKSGFFPPGTTAAPSLLEPLGALAAAGVRHDLAALAPALFGNRWRMCDRHREARRAPCRCWKVARSSEMEAPGRRLPVKANQPNRIDHADAGLQCQQSQVPA